MHIVSYMTVPILNFVMDLCFKCEQFNVQCFADDFPLRGRPLKSICKAGKSGCTFCNLVLMSLRSKPHTNAKLVQSGDPMLSPSIRGAAMIHFWISQSTDTPDEQQNGLGITYLHVVLGNRVHMMENAYLYKVSFRTAADVG
jgi:hypothetical protein